MNKQKILIICALLVFVILLVILFFLSRSKSNPGPVPVVIPTQAPVPTDAPIPTIEPQVTSSLIFETVPTGKAADTFDKQLHDNLQKQEQIQRPDIVVSNSTPYSTEKFIVTTEFVDELGGYFAVTVTKVVEEDVKKDIHDWLVSLGLTDESIAKLKITYK